MLKGATSGVRGFTPAGLDSLRGIHAALDRLDPIALGFAEAERQLNIHQRSVARKCATVGLVELAGPRDELLAWERLARRLEQHFPELPRVDEISDVRVPLIGESRALHLSPPERVGAWIAHALAVVGALIGENPAPSETTPDDLRPAKWFSDATANGLYADLLRVAANDQRLVNSVKIHGRWMHSIAEVAAMYPEYRAKLQQAKQSEGSVSGRKA